jgi:chromatin remodeling complex protein RSC6
MAAKKGAKKGGAKKGAKKSSAKKGAAKKGGARKAAKSGAKKGGAKKAAKRTPNAAFMKAMTPSAQLGTVVGTAPLPRTEVTKKLWAYIKRKGLQDAKNRRQINADENLKPIFGGKSSVSMFEMTKLVNKHLTKRVAISNERGALVSAAPPSFADALRIALCALRYPVNCRAAGAS